MPKGLRRWYGGGDLHYIICSCYQRKPFLGSASRRDLFLNIFEQVRQKYEFQVVGYVVMPNHVHLLISETSKATPSHLLKVLKQRTSRDFRAVPRRALKGQFTLRVCERCGGLPRFWQPR